ncbi:conserved protein of unknown function [Tenacibaculum sp. 190524A02b]|uniref:toxin-antitoxin system YwqK family antitoxin n=1 Tax=Tenacibaculum vairaonense TaxID=3137860 RepID=UPI0032B2A0F1
MTQINDKEVDKLLEMISIDNSGGPIYHYKGKPFNGIIQSFYENGNIMDEVQYTNGHIGGVQREYFESGQKKHEYFKYFAKPEGDWKEWDINGNIIHHSIWEKGEKIKTIIK